MFDSIYLSFLPVGHTHFGPDRIGSRVSVGVKKVDIFDTEEYMDLVRQSHTPHPEVELIDKIAHFKKLFNPRLDRDWTGARSRRYNGLCSKRPSTIRRMQDFMYDTSSLHFRFSRDMDGHVVVQDKHTCDVVDWSNVFYPWREQFEEAAGVPKVFRKTSARPEDLTTAESYPIPATRARQIEKYLELVEHRLTEEQNEKLQSLLERMQTLRESGDCHWENNGRFECEDVDVAGSWEDEEESDVEEAAIQLRNDPAIFDNMSQMNERRHGEARNLRNELKAGDFIVYVPFYVDEVPMSQRDPFYLGQVVVVSNTHGKVQIRCHYCPGRNPSRVWERKPWKPWNRQSGMYEDVEVKNIISKVEMNSLTSNGMSIKATSVTKVKKALSTMAMERRDRAGSVREIVSSSEDSSGDELH